MARETDLIKERLDLVDFLRSYLKLLPAGKNLKALCPFHQEKTPSFIVSPERKIWHCFGCGEGGDLITFAMKYENLEFPEALRFLAEKAGVTLRSINPAEQKQFGILYDIHEAAKSFFKQELLKNQKALEYLKERGLKNETVEEFELGFASGGESLTLHLINLGYDVGDIVRSGLAHKNVKGLHRDRFGGRIIFPIVNHVGKVVAFTGRLFEPAPSSEIPKYLNSPETPIFNKSKILYGFNKSKNEIAKSHTAFLVEGQMDFLLAWQSGVQNAVAVSGTGLTPHHLERLRRLADTVIMSFDNDEAGLRALERSLDIFNNFDFHVKVIDLGKFSDPAEAGKENQGFLQQAIQKAKPAFSHIFDHYFKKPASEKKQFDIAYKKRLLRKLLLKIRNIKSQVEQNIWVKELSRASGVSETALIDELQNLPSAGDEAVETQESKTTPPERIDLIATRILSLVFAEKKLFNILKSHREWLPDQYQRLIDNSKDEQIGALEMRSSYEFADKDPVLLRREFEDLIVQLQIESLRRQMEDLRGEIKLAQEKDDEQEISDIMVRFNVLAQKINELK